MNLPHVIIKGLVSQDGDGKDISPRSTGNTLKEMQNILHGKRTLRQNAVGVIYLEELLGPDTEGLSV